MGDHADVHCYTPLEFERKRKSLPLVRRVSDQGVDLLVAARDGTALRLSHRHGAIAVHAAAAADTERSPPGDAGRRRPRSGLRGDRRALPPAAAALSAPAAQRGAGGGRAAGDLRARLAGAARRHRRPRPAPVAVPHRPQPGAQHAARGRRGAARGDRGLPRREPRGPRRAPRGDARDARRDPGAPRAPARGARRGRGGRSPARRRRGRAGYERRRAAPAPAARAHDAARRRVGVDALPAADVAGRWPGGVGRARGRGRRRRRRRGRRGQGRRRHARRRSARGRGPALRGDHAPARAKTTPDSLRPIAPWRRGGQRRSAAPSADHRPPRSSSRPRSTGRPAATAAPATTAATRPLTGRAPPARAPADAAARASDDAASGHDGSSTSGPGGSAGARTPPATARRAAAVGWRHVGRRHVGQRHVGQRHAGSGTSGSGTSGRGPSGRTGGDDGRRRRRHHAVRAGRDPAARTGLRRCHHVGRGLGFLGRGLRRPGLGRRAARATRVRAPDRTASPREGEPAWVEASRPAVVRRPLLGTLGLPLARGTTARGATDSFAR